MAKRRIVTTEEIEQVEPVEPQGREPDPDERREAEEAEKLAEFQAKFADRGYKLRVERFSKDPLGWEILELFPLDDFDMYAALKPYGKGKYRLTMLNEHGKYVEGGRQTILMGGAPPGAAIQADQVRRDENPLTNPVVSMMIEQMRSSQTQMTELFKAALAKPSPEPAQKPPTLSELLELVSKLKSMSPSDESFGKKFNELATMMEVMDRFRGERGGESDGVGGFLRELREAITAAKELGMINVRRQPNPPESAPPTQPQIETPIKVNLPTPNETSPVSNPILDGLRPYAAIFRQKAENNADVADAAAYLIEELYTTVCPMIRRNVLMAKFSSDDAIVEMIVNRARDAEQIEHIFAAAPELAPHREWCLKVIAEAVKQLNESESEPAQEN